MKMVGQAYWYGTCVYACTSSLLSRKSQQYPAHYGSSRTSTYKKHIASRMVCTDCSGLIKGFFWTNGGQGVINYLNGGSEFKNNYGSNGFPDKGANSMLSWLKSEGCKHGKIATLPEVPGVLLFKSGHVGVYVGNGYAVEAEGFAYGVVKTKVSKRPWTEWAYLPASLLDYDGNETDVPVETLKLGDRLPLKRTSPMMEGDDVRELQTRLNGLGYNCGTIDGQFGKNTEAGVKAFQRAAQIEIDGEFGKNSLAALEAMQKPQETPEPDEEAPDTGTIYPVHGFIPDVSAYQVEINMDEFCAGNDFAIFRARVNGKDDSKFTSWAAELKKRGLADGVTYEREREFIRKYVDRLREHGVKCVGQYTGDYRWRTQYRSLEPIFDTLWIASWGSNSGTYTGWELNKSADYCGRAGHQPPYRP